MIVKLTLSAVKREFCENYNNNVIMMKAMISVDSNNKNTFFFFKCQFVVCFFDMPCFFLLSFLFGFSLALTA